MKIPSEALDQSVGEFPRLQLPAGTVFQPDLGVGPLVFTGGTHDTGNTSSDIGPRVADDPLITCRFSQFWDEVLPVSPGGMPQLTRCSYNEV